MQEFLAKNSKAVTWSLQLCKKQCGCYPGWSGSDGSRRRGKADFYPERKNEDALILELKIDSTPEEAITQIRDKNFAFRFKGKLGEKANISVSRERMRRLVPESIGDKAQRASSSCLPPGNRSSGSQGLSNVLTRFGLEVIIRKTRQCRKPYGIWMPGDADTPDLSESF